MKEVITMKKMSYEITMPYSYNPEKKGAKYSMDGGVTYKNKGEWIESIMKFSRGLDYMVNPATSFDNGSDIEEINASVKSSGASLACVYGDNMESILNEYFSRVHSTLWIYGVVIEDTIYEYHMNATEFREFLKNWAGLTKESGSENIKVRIKKTSGKMIKWIEERVEE